MKNLKVYITVLAIAFSFFPVSLKADSARNVNKADSSAAMQIRSQVLMNRIVEIKDMNFSDMDRTEKKELAEEVTAAKKELKALGGGVYLSVGAIILIALVLILIL
ncbi:hypothetical protein [Marivirga sp.]|uniref:hypothetical protein n=1 Tax=Marivirga sp. TaxID=2018662 RepID=UPI002D806F93|nr:hypothetical protein [Marivirga sp.]HET8859115.1 hypothetical protein [Marivirga sp.]